MQNLGTLDRIVRLLLVVVIAVLYAVGVIKGALAIVLLIIAVILLLESLFGFCPIYKLLGISTKRKKEKIAAKKSQVAKAKPKAKGVKGRKK